MAPPDRYVDPAAAALLSDHPAPRRALFLDRDGVINVDHGYVHTADRTQWLPGIFESCQRALASGYLPVVVTNQAGIGRGHYTVATFIAHTRWLHAQFHDRGATLLATFYCPHHPTGGLGDYGIECDCRKPRPGMFLAAALEFQLDMAASVMIGDKASDLRAAADAGVGRCLLLGDPAQLAMAPAGSVRIPSLAAVFPDDARTQSAQVNP